jgi:hypothetical protein
MSNLEAQMNRQPTQLQSPPTTLIMRLMKSLRRHMKTFHLLAAPLEKLPWTQGNEALALPLGRLLQSPESAINHQTQKILLRRLSLTLRYWRAH